MEKEQPLSHVDSTGKLRMVDVTGKRSTLRRAQARCVVRTTVEILTLGPSENGVDVIHASRLAGIQAAKQTANIIPLCHPLNINDLDVEIDVRGRSVEITATVTAQHRTGVEMEALTACAFAGLGVISALLVVDPTAQLDDLVLLRKSGGKSGDWGRLVEAGK
jgi:cyclic pyranopterin phosphate synthase